MFYIEYWDNDWEIWDKKFVFAGCERFFNGLRHFSSCPSYKIIVGELK